MKQTLKWFRRSVAAVTVAALAAAMSVSCVSEQIAGGGDTGRTGDTGDRREMTFNIGVPAGTTVSTRAVDAAQDNAVHDLVFLLFGEDDKLLPRSGWCSVVSENIAPATAGGSTCSVTVSVHRDARKAIAVANWAGYRGHSDVDDLAADCYEELAGKTTAQVMNSEAFLYDAFPGSPRADFTAAHPYHLMGSAPFAVADGATVPLIRSMAAIDVDARTVADFKLLDVRLVNVNSKALTLPSATSDGRNIPAAPAAIHNENNPVVYGMGGGATCLLSSIFLPEMEVANSPGLDDLTDPAQWRSAPALLIRARISTGNVEEDRWFRVNLRMKDLDDVDLDGDRTELKHVSFRRNHRYTVNITAVGDRGYGSAGEAYEHPSGLVTEMEAHDDTDDADMNDITYNGRYQLTTNGSALTLASHAQTGALKIFTDYPGGWRIESVAYSPADGSWLTGHQIAVGKTGVNPEGKTDVLPFTVSENTTGAQRKATVTITAGPLRQVVELSQDIPGATYMDITPRIRVLPWDAGTTGETAVFNVSADGPWSVTDIVYDNSNESDFTVTSARTGTGANYYDGTVTVTALRDNIIVQDRRVALTVTAPGARTSAAAPKTVEVNHQFRSVRAVEGMIGYIWNPGGERHLELTLEGDRDYYYGDRTKGEPVSSQSRYQVHAATIVPGSLVVMNSLLNSLWENVFDADDIIAWPEAWAADRAAMEAKLGGAVGGEAMQRLPSMYGLNRREGYESISAGDQFPSPEFPAIESAALGDPCAYYFPGWRTPTAAEYEPLLQWKVKTSGIAGYPTLAGVSYDGLLYLSVGRTNGNGSFPHAGRDGIFWRHPDGPLYLPSLKRSNLSEINEILADYGTTTVAGIDPYYPDAIILSTLSFKTTPIDMTDERLIANPGGDNSRPTSVSGITYRCVRNN